MSFNSKFDFCLISNPYNKNGKNIIFITSRGLDYIDETIISDENYIKTKSFLQNNNFSEIEFCSFESNEDAFMLKNSDEIISKLEDRGLKYSKSLEMKITHEMEEMHKHDMESRKLFPEVFHTSQHNHPSTAVFNEFQKPNNPPKYKVPEVGEKINLYFYLLLECHFINDNDCVLDLNGDFHNSENNHFRNFLKIAKSDFVRIESDIPNVLAFQSTKTYSDFIKEVNILYNGKFKTIKHFMTEVGQKGYKTNEYVYNFVEVKKNVNPENHITIQVNLNSYFNEMIERSKAIKKELTTNEKKTVSIEFIKSEINTVKNKLSNKMMTLASEDEYEKANYIKNNITKIDDKLKVINNIDNETILFGEYMKIFTLE